MGVKGQLNIAEYVYDFDVDGGATGTIVLSSKDGKGVIPTGAVIKSVTAFVATACTSGGSATISWGNDDVDGFSGTALAVDGFTANATFNGYDNDAALLWDTTNDHPIYPAIVSAAKGVFNIVIGTAALTAGKIVFTVEYLLPGIDG